MFAHTNLITYESLYSSSYLLNEYLLYDKLWGPSQRVVTLFKTIHAQENGGRGTHFANFLISNFINGLTYTLECMPLLCPLSLTLVSIYLAQRPPSTNARLRNFDFLSDTNNWTLLLNICLLWGPLEAHSGDPINNLFWVQSKAKKTRLWRGAGGSQ